MIDVYTLILSLVLLFSCIEFSLQSGFYVPKHHPSYQHPRNPAGTEPTHLYKMGFIPPRPIVRVYAEQLKCMYTIEGNKEYWVLMSNGARYHEFFAIKMFGAGYAIYDEGGIRSAMRTTGRIRHLFNGEDTSIDATNPVFKIPANSLPAPCPTDQHEESSTNPPFLQGRAYGHWLIPYGVTVKVIQNLPRGTQRFYIPEVNKKFEVLRNEENEVFAIKEFNQLHLLYDRDDVLTVFHMITGMPRKLHRNEKEYFDTLPETVKQTSSLEELREDPYKKQYRERKAGRPRGNDYSSSSGPSNYNQGHFK